MNTQSVTVRYRPIRIGWCIRSGDFEAMREALRLTFTMWGGRYNPLIPVDDFEFACSLVRLFRVDVLWPISKDEVVKKFIDRFPHLPNPFFTEELFVLDGNGDRDPRIVDIYHPIRRLYEEHFKNNPTPDTTVTIFEWQLEDPLADVLLATLGAFPTAGATGTDYISLLKRDLSAKTIVINPDAPLHQFSKEVWPVSAFAHAFIQQHYQIQNYWGYPGVYVGHVDNFEDQIIFWNLRATNTSLMFYDPSYASRFQPSLMTWLEDLRSRPSGRFGSEDSITIWLGNQMAGSDISIFGQRISLRDVRKEIWNGSNIKAPYMYFSEAPVLAVIGESAGGFPKMSFQLPPKPFFEDEKLRVQCMIVSVDPRIRSFGNEQTTFQIPFVPELNEYYGRQCCYQINGARAEPSGLGIVCSASGSSMFLNSLHIMELVKQLFLISGIDANPSTPGLIATRLVQRMGGLQGCRVFKIGGVRKLIEQCKPDKSFTRSGALQTIRADPTSGIESFDKYKDLFIEQRSRGIDLKPESVLAYLLKRGVFRAGLVFDCPSCTLDFWISLDDVGSEVSCEYCGHTFNATPLLKDRDWRFRRSGLFGRDNNQEGAIPVILTLQQLDTLYTGEILFATAMKLKSNNANALNCETDFVAIVQRPSDGKIDIAIGECKTRKEISDDDVNNLQAVAESFSRNQFNVFIIFSKLTSFSSKELERIRRLNNDYHRRVILLTSRELEPYFLYEETSKEFEINHLAISFEDMVNTTEKVFFSQSESE